jgi:hypothetical protein
MTISIKIEKEKDKCTIQKSEIPADGEPSCCQKRKDELRKRTAEF